MLRLLRDIFAYRQFVKLQVQADLETAHSGTYLGWLWWFVEPLLLLLVYVALVTILRGGIAGRADYVLGLAAVLIPWQWFVKCLLRTGTKFVASAGLILQVPFPKATLITADVLSNMLTAVLGEAVILVISAFVMGHVPGPAVLLLPVVLLTQLMLSLAAAMIYITAYMYVRDLHNAVDFALRLGWFLAPGLWTLSMIHDPRMQRLVWLNPFTTLFESYRRIVVFNEMPPLPQLAVLATASLALLMVAVRLFYARERTFAKLV